MTFVESYGRSVMRVLPPQSRVMRSLLFYHQISAALPSWWILRPWQWVLMDVPEIIRPRLAYQV
jgi:hypothetical protein